MATLLIVEDACDGPAVVDVLQQANATWELLSTSDPEHAVSLASNSGIDLVILDLAAPRLDTLSLLERFQQQNPSLPIVVLASPGNEQLVVQALCGGATTYVPHASLSEYLSSSVAGVLDAREWSRRQIRLQESMVESISVFSLASDLEWVPAMLQFIQENLTRMGICDEADCMRVGVALEEALLNALYHGNLEVSSELRERDDVEYRALIQKRLLTPPYCDRRIGVEARLKPEQATLVIRDEGEGFDPSAVRDPTAPANLENVSGRGMLLMRTFMDEVHYNDAGNEVTMIKRRYKNT